MGAVAQRAEPGDVVGVQMGVDGLDQFKVELANELQIAIDALQHRIDDQRLAAMPAGEEIGVGAGRAVEELAKDHGRLLLERSYEQSKHPRGLIETSLRENFRAVAPARRSLPA